MAIKAIKTCSTPQKSPENHEEGRRAHLPVEPITAQKEEKYRKGPSEPVPRILASGRQ
jgi:hypothetical protein